MGNRKVGIRKGCPSVTSNFLDFGSYRHYILV